MDETPPPDEHDEVHERFRGIDLSGETLLGTFHVEECMAEGGMGAIYRGTNTNIGVPVAIKVPHVRFLSEPGFTGRFHREIAELVKLRHAHIARILAQGEEDGVPFFVLEFLEGGSLEDRVAGTDGGRLEAADVPAWLGPTADALDYIHGKGVVHRDVKPANILFDDGGQVFVSDFGIAKAAGSADTSLTATGSAVGSPQYMAPEQALGEEITGAADQYSLAATVYELLAGAPTHEGATPVQVLVRKQTEDPTPIGERVAHLPGPAADAIMRALARDPNDRFPTCGAFADAFAEGLRAPAAPPPPLAPSPRAPRSRTPTRVRSASTLESRTPPRGRRYAPLAGGFLVVLLAVGGALMVKGDDEQGDRSTSREASRAPEGPRPGPTKAPASPKPPSDPAPRVAALTLAIDTPIDGAVVPGGPLRVEGSVTGERGDATLMVNGETASVDGTGRFRIDVDMGGATDERRAIRVECSGDHVTCEPAVVHVVVDAKLPVIVLENLPEEETTVSQATFTVRGAVNDTNRTLLTINGKAVALDRDGLWWQSVTLQPGDRHALAIVATDAAGNRSTINRVLIRPLPEVGFAVREPRPGAVFGTREVTIQGVVTGEELPDAVLVHGTRATLTERSFRATITLPSDGIHDVMVVARGVRVLTSAVTVPIVIDTEPPVIRVRAPARSEHVQYERAFELAGRVEDASSVTLTINRRQHALEEEGAFRKRLALPPGRRRLFTLRATDAAGNESEVVRVAATYAFVTPSEAEALGKLPPSEVWQRIEKIDDKREYARQWAQRRSLAAAYLEASRSQVPPDDVVELAAHVEILREADRMEAAVRMAADLSVPRPVKDNFGVWRTGLTAVQRWVASRDAQPVDDALRLVNGLRADLVVLASEVGPADVQVQGWTATLEVAAGRIELARGRLAAALARGQDALGRNAAVAADIVNAIGNALLTDTVSLDKSAATQQQLLGLLADARTANATQRQVASKRSELDDKLREALLAAHKRAAGRFDRAERRFRLLGEPLPDLPILDSFGQGTLVPSGKVVLLEVWSTWVPYSASGWPAIREMRRRFETRGLVVNGIVTLADNPFTAQLERDDDLTAAWVPGTWAHEVKLKSEGAEDKQNEQADLIRRYMLAHRVRGYHEMTSSEAILDKLGATGWPYRLLLDRKGRIRFIQSGVLELDYEDQRRDLARLYAAIDTLLKEEP